MILDLKGHLSINLSGFATVIGAILTFFDLTQHFEWKKINNFVHVILANLHTQTQTSTKNIHTGPFSYCTPHYWRISRLRLLYHNMTFFCIHPLKFSSPSLLPPLSILSPFIAFLSPRLFNLYARHSPYHTFLLLTSPSSPPLPPLSSRLHETTWTPLFLEWNLRSSGQWH